MASPPYAAAPPPPALGGLRALMLLQLSTRAVSVLLAQFLVRIAPPAVFAAAHIHLDLLLSTLLFLAREGVRGALLRAPEDATAAEASAKSDGKSTAASAAQHVAQRERARQNVALLPLVLGAAMLLPAFPLYARLAPASLRELASFRSALALYLLGAALELLAEPLHTRALSRASDTGNGMALRVRAEGAAVLSRCAATAVTLYVAVRRLRIGEADAALLAFACGQAAYGGGTLGVYLVYFLRAWGPRQVAALFTPSRVPLSMPGVELASSQPAADSALLDKHAFALAATMTRQSFLKHLLTEADRIAVARLATLDNQGAYALAGNYGSLFARLLFQPVEESARLVFARSQSSTGEASQSALSLLRPLLSLYIILSLFLAAFAPFFAMPALLLVAGPRWALSTAAPQLLACYAALYLPVLALNGVLEAYLQASASPQTLKRYDGILVLASGAFVGALVLGPQLGLTRGGIDLIVASTLSSGVRALFGAYYAFRAAPAGPSVWPRLSTLVLFAHAPVLFAWTSSRVRAIPLALGVRALARRDVAQHLACGVAGAAVLLAVCYLQEGPKLRLALAAIRGSS